MHLNEFGLWRWNDNEEERGGGGSNEEEPGFWELVRAETEAEVLGELGMEYVEPVKRNFAALAKGVVAARGKGKKRP